MAESKTILATIVEGATAKIKVEIRLEALFLSDQMTAKERMSFLHNVLGWAATKDLADELRLRGYSITVKKKKRNTKQKFCKRYDKFCTSIRRGK